MQTVTDRLQEAGNQIKVLARELLLTHSGLTRDRYVNNPDSGVVFISPAGDHDWNPLDQEGRRLQSQIHQAFERLLAVFRGLLRVQPPPVQRVIADNARTINKVIDQHGLTWIKTTEEAVQNLDAAVDALIEQVVCLHDGSEGNHIYVPDTNALCYNPQLEEWSFDESPVFTMVLMPTVLSELDQLKVNHRNEDFRRKAEGVIRRIKGYRSRGRLSDGVTLRTGRSRLKTIAVEPKMQESLPWLDPGNNDDRLLAALLEVMRIHPRCPVLLVTRDINLQNKADYAGFPFVEPPEPPTPVLPS
jgi:hypothetical protein